mgnify:CR=1 FL=1
MPVSSERYITSIANGQNGSPSHKIKIHCHFVHLPFISFYQYSTDSMKSQYFTVLSGVNKSSMYIKTLFFSRTLSVFVENLCVFVKMVESIIFFLYSECIQLSCFLILIHQQQNQTSSNRNIFTNSFIYYF